MNENKNKSEREQGNRPKIATQLEKKSLLINDKIWDNCYIPSGQSSEENKMKDISRFTRKH